MPKAANFLSIFLLFFSSFLIAQNSLKKKEIEAVFVEKGPRIDAYLDESFWVQAPIADDFTENSPDPNTPSHLPTEVKVVYSTDAIYLAAKMYDSSPDSILKQLSVRDDIQSVNADYFTVLIDGMFTEQNYFSFTVTAAGVQGDAADGDVVWDAAWRSAVRIVEDGWIVEMEIPYSQLRFPKNEVQTWGINFRRSIRRYRESSYWSKIDPEVNGEVQQYGVLKGIEKIKPPIRLSFTPYAAAYLRVEDDGNPATAAVRPTGTAGADLKYGINESFTLDVSLVPDFGDVQFDNLEFNISPFEIYYAERRPFFTEGTAIFNRAGLFYSRRVGALPSRFGTVYPEVDSNENLLRNPERTQLINAMKVSGRTKKGLGIGVFNAVTAPAYAKIQNLDTEEISKIMTEPLTNFNVLVFDQQLMDRKNSYISFVNTNVTRFGKFTDANVSGTEFRITDKKNQYAVSGNAAYSYRLLDPELFSDKYQLGYKTNINFAKIGGKFRYTAGHSIMSRDFNINDLGFVGRTNFMTTSATVTYNIFEPFWIYNNIRFNLGAYMDHLYNPTEFMRVELYGSIFGTTRKFLTAGLDFAYQPWGYNDFYEARVNAQPWLKPAWGRIGGFFSSDYRKPFALDGDISYRRFHNSTPDWNNADIIEGELSPRIRFSDRFNMVLLQNTTIRRNNIGYVRRFTDTDGNLNIIFGSRYYQTLENRITLNYLFTDLISLSFSARHYWALVKYSSFFNLLSDGNLGPTTYSANQDQNYNAFNVDLIFRWRFAPGSELNLVWKNMTLNSSNQLEFNYFDNFAGMFDDNTLNQFSIKLLYFLDVYKLQPSHRRGRRI
jgi:hypothetical protein